MNFPTSIGLVLWATVLVQPSAGFAADPCGVAPPFSFPEGVKKEYRACRAAIIEKRMGKYFCFIQQMVGIQYPEKDGVQGTGLDKTATPFAGKIRPSEEKFFMEISKNKQFDLCKEGSDTSIFCDQEIIQERYEYNSKSTDVSSYGQSTDSFQFHDLSGMFILYGSNDFKSFRTLGSSYLAQGKCEKIN